MPAINKFVIFYVKLRSALFFEKYWPSKSISVIFIPIGWCCQKFLLSVSDWIRRQVTPKCSLSLTDRNGPIRMITSSGRTSARLGCSCWRQKRVKLFYNIFFIIRIKSNSGRKFTHWIGIRIFSSLWVFHLGSTENFLYIRNSMRSAVLLICN